MMILLIKAAILWGVIIGYCLYLRKKNVEMAFAPAMVVCGIGVSVFVAGILNFMLYAVLGICIGGFLCGLLSRPWEMIKNKQLGKHELFCLLGFTVVCVLFALRLRGFKGLHYDNFSHWLTVITEMVKTNRMPNFESELIMFQGYPTGSAGFSYFFCKVLGNSEGVAIFAQSVLLAACLCTFLAFVKKYNLFSIAICILGSIYCLVANIQITELLVDTLISLLGIASVAIIIFYRTDLRKALIYSMSIQVFLITVKNSGMVFLLLNIALLLCVNILSDIDNGRKFNIKNYLSLGVFNISIPMFILFLWNRHVDYVFVNGTTSKHSMTLDNYKNVFADKSLMQVKEILMIFSERFFSINKGIIVLGLVLLGVLIGYLTKVIVMKEKKNYQILIYVGILVSYVGFMAILALMYLVSMPYAESIILASYDRYEKQILIWLVGILIIYILYHFNNLPHKKIAVSKLLLVLMLFVLLLSERSKIPNLFQRIDMYTGSRREQLETIKTQYALPEGANYFIYGQCLTGDGQYTYFLGRYVFWSADVNTCSPEELENKRNLLENYDYLIVLQEDEEINQLLEEKHLSLHQKVYNLSSVVD